MMPFDVDLAFEGILRLPSGRLRSLTGLSRIVAGGERRGVKYLWGQPINGVAEADINERLVVVDPSVGLCDPWVVYDVLSHELGHCLTGSWSCELARSYQDRFFRDLISPERVA